MIGEIVRSICKKGPVLGLQAYYVKLDKKKRIIKKCCKINNCVVILLKSGTFEIKLQHAAYKLLPQEVLIISQNERSSQIITSGKLHIFLMAFSRDYLFQNDLETLGWLISGGTVKSKCYEGEFEAIVQLFKLVCIVNDNKKPAQKIELQCIMELLLFKLSSVCANQVSESASKTGRREKLTVQFHLLLKEHCRTRHNVGFYADKLCITAGYLNKIVKQVTGHTAKNLIEQRIVIEIKKQLQNKEWTLMEIAEQLGFNDLSSFSTFFKTHTSVAPSEYRSQMGNRFLNQ